MIKNGVMHRSRTPMKLQDVSTTLTLTYQAPHDFFLIGANLC